METTAFAILKSFLGVALLVFSIQLLILLLREYWWTPRVITRLLAKQGVQVLPISFRSGNTAEIAKLCKAVASRDMECLNHDIVHRLVPHFSYWSKIYGKRFLFWWGTEPGMFVTEPALIKEIMTFTEGKGPYCRAMTKQSANRHNLFGNGILSASGKAWEHQRAGLSPIFRQNQLKSHVGSMVACATQLVNDWHCVCDGGSAEIDVYRELMNVTSNIIAHAAFGSNYWRAKGVFERMNLLQRLLVESDHSTFPGKSFLPTALNRQIWKITEDINQSLHQIVQQRKESSLHPVSSSHGNDFLGLMLPESETNVNASGVTFSSQQVIDECKSLYFAGYETTTLLITWTLMLLAVNPEWQERARQEAIELSKTGPVDSEMLSRMKIMGMIINESLRIYPPAGLTVRQTTRDTKLGNLFLPRGMNLWIPIVALHHDPDLWGPNSHCFIPERFTDGVAGATKGCLTFIPFGHGTRSCLGNNFAIMEAKVVLTMIVTRFRWRLSPNYRHSPVLFLTSKPLHGMPLILESLTI